MYAGWMNKAYVYTRTKIKSLCTVDILLALNENIIIINVLENVLPYRLESIVFIWIRDKASM